MTLNSIVQAVDVTASLEATDGVLPVPDELSVVEMEVERVFGGGGSMAELTVVFDDYLTEQQKEDLEAIADPEGHFQDSEGELFDTATTAFFERPGRLESQITLTVDVAIAAPAFDTIDDQKFRLFTGSLTKITEDAERTVTLHAMDRRYELNRNSVIIDTAEMAVTTDVLVQNALESLGWTRKRQDDTNWDYQIDLRDKNGRVTEPEAVTNRSWGIESHTTAFEFLQDLAHIEGATIHIDRLNRLHFVRYPQHSLWTPRGGGDDERTLPPIVDWESGNEENQTDVIVEATHNETGLGAYSVVGEDKLDAATDYVLDDQEQFKRVSDLGVVSRSALENAREWEFTAEELQRDSGTIRVVGDPRIEPYDEVVLDSDATNGFAPISDGTYMSKTSRHIIDNQNGYVVEIELGKDPEELFEMFTGEAGTRNTGDVTTEDETGGGGSGFFESIVKATFSPGPLLPTP